jgi:hypothetical protein
MTTPDKRSFETEREARPDLPPAEADDHARPDEPDEAKLKRQGDRLQSSVDKATGADQPRR